MALSLTGFFDGRQERLSEQGLSALTLSKAHAAKGTSQGGSKGEASFRCFTLYFLERVEKTLFCERRAFGLTERGAFGLV